MTTPPPYWIAFGDVHGHVDQLANIPELPGAAGVVITGDLTNRGGVREARRVVEAVAAVNPRVMAQIGNMDYEAVQGWLDESGRGIHARAVELAPDLGLMGVGWSSPTPFGTPSEAPDAQLGKWLDEAYEKARKFRHLILVSHTPPLNTKTDAIGQGTHVGSQAVRSFIERVKPQLCITGHIHEARGTDTIGDTLVINPGDLASGGYVLIGYDGRAVTARLMTTS
ncbi:MAG: metallophosphoesterase [Acidobacteriota bacterium]